MKRRRLIAVISICTLAAFAVLAIAAGVVLMNTDLARQFIQGRVAAAVNGSVYIGRISGNPFSGIVIDSLAIRDRSGEMVLSTGRIAADYDIRDLMDTRLHLRHVIAERPFLHLRQREGGSWNYQELLKKGPAGPSRDGPGRSWGDYVVLDSVRAIGATFMLSQPWRPDDTLQGAARERVIAEALARRDRLFRRTADGFAQTYVWTQGSGLISHARLVDPDSNRFGQEIHIAHLDVNEFYPPFLFRNVSGVIRRLSDTAWLKFRHFDLLNADSGSARRPGSTGSASGKLVWGGDIPMRYDVTVRADSVSLKDINWVYATLPKTGVGRMVLRISNKRNLQVMDYHVDSLDVRSTGSHLKGEMTFGVGGPVLQLRNVNLTADPLDFDLIHTLSGGPLPIDWRGQIFGDIRAPGGPLTHFEVDTARGEWRDKHVPGAVSRLGGSGGLNILEPALTQFHDFDLSVGTLDLRSIRFLFPAFPPLRGTIAGRATLDSVWSDVRFRRANIVHRDGPGVPSRFTGSGRITDGSPFIRYNLDLVAAPLSLDMLARSFPTIKLRGLASGPIKIRGTSPDLAIVAALTTPTGGALQFAGNIDIDSLGGFGARGRGEVTNVNLAQLLTRPTAPVTSLNARYSLDIRGATAATLRGTAEFQLSRSTIDSVTIDTLSLATITFDSGKAVLRDTVKIFSPLGQVLVAGGIGLPKGASDSISVTLTVDSVGGFRPYFSTASPARADSMTGTVLVNGTVTGRLDSLMVEGTIAGENLYLRGLDARRLDGKFAVFDALRAPRGWLEAQFRTVVAGGLQFDSVNTEVRLHDTSNAAFKARGLGTRIENLDFTALGSWSALGPLSTVRFDSLSLAMADSRWALEQPATIRIDSGMFRVDTLAFRDGKGGSIGVAGFVPNVGPVDLRFSAARVPLADIDRVAGRIRAPLAGFADLNANVTGTRDSPVIGLRSTLDSIALSDVSIGRLFATAKYANQSAAVNVDIFQGDKRVFNATADSLPLSVTFFDYDTLPGRVRARATADGADFTLIQAFVSDISNVKGKVFGDLTLDGSWSAPNLAAHARLDSGGMRIDTLGITLTNMNGPVIFRHDSLLVDPNNPLRAQSGGQGTGSIWGEIAFQKWTPSWFNLSMDLRDLLVYDRRELATIYATTDSGPVRLRGSFDHDTLTGIVNVNRGAIYLPDPKLVGKTYSQAGILDADTVLFRGARRDTALYDRVTRNLETDLKVHIGGSFLLSADYAEIPLSGDLRIVPVRFANTADDYISRLAPEGVINADRGTYTLDLFPLRRTFTVERGGTITFDRDAEWNGLLNISARYVVRPFGRPEVPVIVDVTDRLLTPKVKPRSDASFYISDSDLISYLVFGEPGFDVLGQTSRSRQGSGLVSTLFTPIVTSFAAEQLRQSVLRGWVDQFRLESANLDQANGAGGNQLSRALLTTRFAAEKGLLGDKLFVSVSAGFCGFDAQYRATGQTAGQSHLEQVGFNLDWRLKSTLHSGATWQFASEPSTVALLCSPGYVGTGGTAPTPRQYSLSFLKFWRW
jgi:translocation and assembly module TamB